MFSCCMIDQPLENKDQKTRCSADPIPSWNKPETSPEMIANHVEQQQKSEAKAQSRSWISFFNCMACQCRVLVDRNSYKASHELPSKNREVDLELEDIGDGDHKTQSKIAHLASASI